MSTRIRLIDVAAAAGVSRVAVGKVLLNSGGDHIKVSEMTARRIREASRKLGYEPNRSAQRLRGMSGQLIGVVINMNAPAIERDRLVAFERLAWKQGYQLLISAISVPEKIDEVAACASILTGQGAAGVAFLTGGVMVAGSERDPRLPSKAVYCGIKQVLGDAPGVVFDLDDGYRQSIEHFASASRQRVGFVTQQGTMTPNVYSKHAYRGACKIVAGFEGMSLVHCPIKVSPELRIPSPGQADKVVKALLKEGVEAIQAGDDQIAARLIQALHRSGVRIPEDIAVCGLGNVDIADLTSPTLTTIDEHAANVSEAMLDLLISQLTGAGHSDHQRIIKPTLIIRESS